MMPLVSTTLTVPSSTIGTSWSQHPLPPPPLEKIKKKRNASGNPDPDAIIISLSPRTIMEPNRFVCEICYQSFVREQNLEMHYRSHNRPWRIGTAEKVKKAFVCPDEDCVHHHPSRALQDLSAIRKHFIRKHKEKIWKCHTCPKAYAVEGDLKAHAKICGSIQYKCDRCGFTVNRKDTYTNHKKWCDELAQKQAIMSTTLPQTDITFQSLLHPHLPNMLGSIPDYFSTASMFPPVVYTGDGLNPTNNIGLIPGSFDIGDFSTISQIPPVVSLDNYTENTFKPGSFGDMNFSTTLFPLVLPLENYPGDELNAGSFGVGGFSTTPLFPPVVSPENYTGDTFNPESFGVGNFSTTPLFSPVLPSENYLKSDLNPGSFDVGGSFTTFQFAPVVSPKHYTGDTFNPESFDVPVVPPSENYPGDALNYQGSFGVGFTTTSQFPPAISPNNYTWDTFNPEPIGVGDFCTTSLISPVLPSENYPGNDLNQGSFGFGDSSTTSLFPRNVFSENNTGDAFNPVNNSTGSIGVDDFSSIFPLDASSEHYTAEDSFDVDDFSPFLPGSIGEGTRIQDLTALQPLPESIEIPSLLQNVTNQEMLGFPWPNWS